MTRAWQRNTKALRTWVPTVGVTVPAQVVIATQQSDGAARSAAWQNLLPDARVWQVNADHFSILQEPVIDDLCRSIAAPQLQEEMEE